MNKVLVTQRGLQFFNESKDQSEKKYITRPKTDPQNQKTFITLPRLISSAPMSKKRQISQKLLHLTLKLTNLKSTGLKKILLDVQDQTLTKIMQKAFQDRKTYLRTIVPTLVKKTRDTNHFGNIRGRLERSRAYIDRLQQKYDKSLKFSDNNDKKIKQKKDDVIF